MNFSQTNKVVAFSVTKSAENNKKVTLYIIFFMDIYWSVFQQPALLVKCVYVCLMCQGLNQ